MSIRKLTKIMRIKVLSELFWYEPRSFPVLAGCKGICVFDVARIGIGLADLLQVLLSSDSVCLITLTALSTNYSVLVFLLVQAKFALLTFLTLRRLEPAFGRLLLHAVVKVVLVPVQGGLYWGCIYLQWREDSNTGRATALGICLLILLVIELYLALGLYSGYELGEGGALSPRNRGEAAEPEMPIKLVIGVPITAESRPDFVIPVYDYTNYEEKPDTD